MKRTTISRAVRVSLDQSLAGVWCVNMPSGTETTINRFHVDYEHGGSSDKALEAATNASLNIDREIEAHEAWNTLEHSERESWRRKYSHSDAWDSYPTVAHFYLAERAA